MDSPSPLDPKGAAGRLKPQLQLIPPVLNTETAKALQHGADKYGPWKWRTAKVEIMTYLGAMKRHLDAVLNREDMDAASGAHHLGHVAASCGIVLDAAENGTLVDNRPPAASADKVWAAPEMVVDMRDFRADTTDQDIERIRKLYPGFDGALSEGQVITTSPAFKRPVDGMTLTSVMAHVQRNSISTTNQLTAIEDALAPLFEPTPVQ